MMKHNLILKSVIAVLVLMSVSTLSHAQGELIVVEEAIEGAQFKEFNVTQTGYGYLVVENCRVCGDNGMRLSVNPDIEIKVNGSPVNVRAFNPSANGFTMLFYKKDENRVTRIHRSNP